MSSLETDRYIFAYVDAVGTKNISMDLGRPEKLVKARVTRLKNSGAWDALGRLAQAEATHTAEYFNALGIKHFLDECSEYELSEVPK